MTQIKLRRDTSANFTSANPILGNGEPAYETDTKKLKIGDGTTAYTQLEYFSVGGSTNITATLPLKIVDGVISLDVDGQTIQIVDGKLHANLDELSNTVNTLSGDVETLLDDLYQTQADVQSNIESITNLQNDKEDAFKAIQPLVKTRTETNPVVGFTNNIGGKAWDRATGSLTLKDMSGAGYCLTDAYGNDAQVIDSKLILKKYILIPYTQGQIVRIPAKVSDSNASYAVSLVNVDSNGNIDYISNDNAMNQHQPNLNAKGSEYTQSSQYIRAVTRISGAASTGDYSSVNVTSNLTDSILIQLRVTDTKSTYALSIGRLSRNGYSNAYTSTDINVINRLKDVNALLLTRIGSTSSFAGIGVSESAPYDLSLIQVFEDDGTTLETLTDPVGFVNSHTNIYDATKNIINNSLSLSIGSGLSVVDGKLSADTVTVDAYTKEQTNALLATKQDKIVTLTKEAYDALTEKKPNTIYMIEGETQDAGGDKVTVTSNEYTVISPNPTNGVWYKSLGNGYIVARFMSSSGNQFCQLAVNATGTGTLDDNSIYNQTAFSQGNNNGFTLLLPISSTQYYAVNTNFGRGLQWARFIPFITV